jgi:hypothetical protein
MLDQRQIDLLEQAAAAVPAGSLLRPWVLARLSVALSFVGSEDRRLELADEAVVLARAGGDPAALAAALASRCDAVAGPDHVSERLGAATEIVALARAAGDRALELLGRRFRVIALCEFGSMVDVDEEIAAFDRLATLHGDPLYRWYVPLWRGMRALSRGELAEAERCALEAFELGSHAGSATPWCSRRCCGSSSSWSGVTRSRPNASGAWRATRIPSWWDRPGCRCSCGCSPWSARTRRPGATWRRYAPTGSTDYPGTRSGCRS